MHYRIANFSDFFFREVLRPSAEVREGPEVIVSYDDEMSDGPAHGPEDNGASLRKDISK